MAEGAQRADGAEGVERGLDCEIQFGVHISGDWGDGLREMEFRMPLIVSLGFRV